MGYDDFEGGGVTLFPYYDLGGGCGKLHRAYGGGQPFFDTAWPVVMQWFNEDH